MGLADELSKEVGSIIRTRWNSRDGIVVPEPENVALGNNAVKLTATVLYADLAASTELVQEHDPRFAAEVYKCYLRCAARIVRAEGGTITAYDGDRIMGVFAGQMKNTRATRCALKINHAVTQIINPALQSFYETDFELEHAVGVDTSDLLVARTGIRGSNDLVWVGRAANFAARLSTFREPPYTSWITADVYDKMAADAKQSNGTPMWEKRSWNARNLSVYRSSWYWKP
jgi:class 3 adenylate cyclase